MSATLSRYLSLFFLMLVLVFLSIGETTNAIEYNVSITQNITLETGNQKATQYTASQQVTYSQNQKQALQITQQAPINKTNEWSMAQYRLIEQGIGYIYQGQQNNQQVWNETPATYTYSMYPMQTTTYTEYYTTTITVTKTITGPNGETTVVTEVKTVTIPLEENPHKRATILGIGLTVLFLLFLLSRLR